MSQRITIDFPSIEAAGDQSALVYQDSSDRYLAQIRCPTRFPKCQLHPAKIFIHGFDRLVFDRPVFHRQGSDRRK